MNTPRTSFLLALLALITVAASPVRAVGTPQPSDFFTPQVYVGDAGNGYSAYYLQYFGYYAYPPDTTEYLYKFNFGFLYYFKQGGSLSTDEAYFYDFTEKDYFYTTVSLYPYFYSFNRGTFLYYFEDSKPRQFYDFKAGSYIAY